MTTMICIIYLGTVVGVILPRLDTLINEKDDYVSIFSFFIRVINEINGNTYFIIMLNYMMILCMTVYAISQFI